ncbi:hypothetical protein LCGC14_1885840, partial [marine sediment metagenome]
MTAMTGDYNSNEFYTNNSNEFYMKSTRSCTHLSSIENRYYNWKGDYDKTLITTIDYALSQIHTGTTANTIPDKLAYEEA